VSKKAPRYDVPNAAPGALRLVQELVNTVDKEHGREWLASPAELESWLRARRLEAGRVTTAGLARMHAFRDALRPLLVANNERNPVPEPALRELEAAARRGKLTLAFDATGTVRLVAEAVSVDGAIGTILACVYDTMADGSWPRLKACRNCRWAFYDYSRNRSAAWCSMSICGNRLKTRAYRRRLGARHE
jgi:predicted RNA-binding Zn ribbon-like protein